MDEEKKDIKYIQNLFESTGINTVYGVQKEKIETPYICFYFLENVVFYADGIPYYKKIKIGADLYTKYKDLNAEKKVEEAISGYPWQKTENYIDDEDCYQISYEIEV